MPDIRTQRINITANPATELTPSFVGMLFLDSNNVLRADTVGSGTITDFLPVLPEHKISGEHGPQVNITQESASPALVVTQNFASRAISVTCGSTASGNALNIASASNTSRAVEITTTGTGSIDALHIDVNGSGRALFTEGGNIQFNDGNININASAGSDASILFTEDNTDRYELGYDESANGLVIGRTDFSNPVMLVRDSDGSVQFLGTEAQQADVQINVTGNYTQGLRIDDAVGGATLLYVHKENTSASNDSVAIFDDDRVNNTASTVRVLKSTGDGLALEVTSAGNARTLSVINTDSSGNMTQAAYFEKSTVNGPACVEMVDPGSAGVLLLDQNGNGYGLRIDSEATLRPLIDLAPIVGNNRGDIAFGIARTSDPSSPVEGDLWYNSTSNVLKYYDGTSVKTLATV